MPDEYIDCRQLHHESSAIISEVSSAPSRGALFIIAPCESPKFCFRYFFLKLFDRPDSPIFSKGGGKRNEKTMENNDSKIKSRQRKIALCVDTNVK